MGEGYLSHTCTLFFQAKILKLNDIHKFIVCNYMFKNLEKFQESGGQHHYATRNRNLLCPNFQRLALTQHSIFFSGPHFWNSLPINLRSIDEFHMFKKQLKLYLIDQYAQQEFRVYPHGREFAVSVSVDQKVTAGVQIAIAGYRSQNTS